MRVKLEDVCERGSSNLKQSDVIDKVGEYPVYGAAGYLGNIDFYHQEKPYVSVVKDGAGIGRTTLHPSKSSVIGTMQYLLPKDNVLPEYLCYVVRYMHLEKYFTGATIPHIYFKDYKNEEFNLDTLDRQIEIVGILKKVENIIELRRQEIEKLDDVIKARFVEMFGDPVANPYGWEEHRLDTTRINPLYVSYYLETAGGKMQFESKNQNGVKAGLNFDAIKSLKLLVPPLYKQEEYLTFVSQVDKSKVSVQKALDETQLLFDSLMQQHFG